MSSSRGLFVHLAMLALEAMKKGETPVTGTRVLNASSRFNRNFRRSRKHDKSEEELKAKERRRREALDRKKLKATRKLGRRGLHNARK